jgi:GTPase SAR1 family protein
MDSEIVDIIKRYKELTLQNANEAETRKKFVDRIISEVLDWSDDDVRYEERVSEDGNTTYADYIVRTANSSFLIEAKRIGVSFLSVPDRRKVKLSGKFMEGPTGDAIKQARDYCRKKSIPFAVVTNGAQWIIFPAVRTDEIPFSDSYAVVFESLENTLGEEIDYFKSLLSRNGVIEGNLGIELLGRSSDQIGERRLNNFFKGADTRPVNPIYPLIENSVLTSFSDSIIDKDPELLEKCYVKNADRAKFDNRIQMHLQKSEPLFRVQPKRPLRKREAGSLNDAIKASISAMRPVAILILGTVGAGKTTFLQFTRKVSASHYFSKAKDKLYPHWIEADYRDFSLQENSMDFLYSQIFEYLKTDDFFSNYDRAIRSAYKNEIDSLKKGPMHLVSSDQEKFNEKISEIIVSDYNQVKPYVDKLLKYGASKSPIFLVIDNVDQFEDEEKQSLIFADAMALAARLKLNLIIAMRESTYVLHRNQPTFDAFDFDPIQIEPPEIPAVLSRRFFITKQQLKGVQGEFTALNGANFKVEDLSVFVDIVQSSVLGTDVGNHIEVLSNHDVRLALRMTREFLAKGYTDPAKAIKSYNSTGTYVLPKQEAFRSILLGNQSVYSEKFSVIGNPFDARLERTQEQLLRLFILTSLVKSSSSSNSQYIDCGSIRGKMHLIGFSEEDTMKVLADLCKLRFIHTSSHDKPNLNSSFYPSRLGGYVVRNLLIDFAFLENVLMDTFIASKSIWESLKNLTNIINDERNVVRKIKSRIKRVNVFYEYMNDLYKPLVEEANLRGLDANWLANPFLEYKDELEGITNRILASAIKNYGSSSENRKLPRKH